MEKAFHTSPGIRLKNTHAKSHDHQSKHLVVIVGQTDTQMKCWILNIKLRPRFALSVNLEKVTRAIQ